MPLSRSARAAPRQAETEGLTPVRSKSSSTGASAPPEPPPLTAKAALRQAEAEGLTLLRFESSSTGYKGVVFKSNRPRPYQARVTRDGKTVSLGCYATAEEAALCDARTPEAQAAAALLLEPPPLTAEEARKQAEAEGLTLLRSEGGRYSTGYKGVCLDSGAKSKPYQAQVHRGGMTVHLGTFAAAEEAALSYARTPEAQAAAALLLEPPPMTAEEAQRQAEAEGLTLLKSENNSTGYKGVGFNSLGSKPYSGGSKPYKAQVRSGGRTVHLGSFATAEEAALIVARDSAARAAAPQPTATSSRKRKAQPEELPPDVRADVVVILEGRFVDSSWMESPCPVSK